MEMWYVISVKVKKIRWRFDLAHTTPCLFLSVCWSP